MKKPNPIAQALGRLAKGKPKTLTAAQRKFRAQQLAAARADRWLNSLALTKQHYVQTSAPKKKGKP